MGLDQKWLAPREVERADMREDGLHLGPELVAAGFLHVEDRYRDGAVASW